MKVKGWKALLKRTHLILKMNKIYRVNILSAGRSGHVEEDAAKICKIGVNICKG